jgi:hypothetical protein
VWWTKFIYILQGSGFEAILEFFVIYVRNILKTFYAKYALASQQIDLFDSPCRHCVA